jgi:hypothetical protein
MATRLFPNTGHKIVDNIVLRNLLPERFDGQEVTVRDATDDPLLGSGSASYKWMASQNRWALTWSDVYPTMSFAHEDLLITDGKATASNIPASGVVWAAYIIDPVDDGILQDVKPAVNLAELSLLTNDFDGKKLRVSYGYGSVASQIMSVSGDFASVTHTHAISDVTGLQTILDTIAPQADIITTFNAVSGSNNSTAEYVNLLLGTE